LSEIVFNGRQGEIGFEGTDLSLTNATELLEGTGSSSSVRPQIGRERLNPSKEVLNPGVKIERLRLRFFFRTNGLR
jgi:hypothetical protein